jgi:pyruvate dehydrogenase E2 component (dihydrolipoamide acetyltransferase)
MHEVRIPKLGLDTLECDIREWLVKPGDTVTKGMPLLEVETEKAVIAVEAEVAGTLAEIHSDAGATVPVGAIVGTIAE